MITLKELTTLRIKDISGTKKSKDFLSNYRGHWGYNSIYDAYDRPSSRKISSFKKWEILKNKYGGYNAKIVSRNSCSYVYAFTVDVKGEFYHCEVIMPVVIYITKDNRYYFYLNQVK